MATTSTYLDYAELAQAAYGNFLDTQTYAEYFNELKREDGTVNLTPTQATTFASRYRIDYQYTDAATGFSATLFWDTTQNRHVISVRGTGDAKDILNDIFLGSSGKAYEQEVALDAFYRRVSTPISDGGLGILGASESIDITGHSLGGFLAQTFTTNHADVVNQAYTYNAPGLGGIAEEVLGVFGFTSALSSEASSKITNLIASDGISLIAGFGAMQGEVLNVPGYTHSMADMTKTLQALILKGINEIEANGHWWNFLSSADRASTAQMLLAGGLPWNYNPSGSIAAIRRDPLTLDLNHDGIINTVSLTSSTTFFNLNNDGMSELSGWIAPSEGMLVYDRNNDGQINSNIEQFGKIDKDGFTELKEIGDSNNDNLFDANDTLYNTLKVWTDTNSDGISQSNELHTPRELNITSIDLSKTVTNIDSNGNAIIATSTFIQDGQSYAAGAVGFGYG